jgi:hypothetical protein
VVEDVSKREEIIMAKTVVGLFDTTAEAQSVVQELINNGFERNDISLVANDARGEYANYRAVGDTTESSAAEGAGAGAVGGGVLGGVLGLLVGVGALAIPGIGPVLAAGPLAAALGAAGASTLVGAGIGAAAGGIIGALVGAGIPEEDAGFYAEGIRRGGTLVMVKASDDMAQRAYDTMRSYGAVDVDERSGTWRQSGWTNFDSNAGPYEGTSDIDDKWERSSKVGTTGGAVAGAATGAAIGSVGGPVGTAIGGVAGAVTGAGVGAAGDVAGKSIEEGSDYDATTRSRDFDTTSTTSRTDYGTGATDIDDKWERSSKVGTAGGAAAGAATGAAIGAVGGPVGMAVGGVAGAATGAGIGAAGDVAGESVEDAYSRYDSDFRTHYQTNATNTGYTYDQYAPVYRYGYGLANDPMYRDRDWSAIESDAQRRWEERNPGTWEQFKDSVRYAWDKARGVR